MSLILEATNRESVRPVTAVHAGIATAEVQAPCVATGHSTRPIEAVGADIEERTTEAAAVARHGQFQRGAECPGRVVAGSTGSFGVPLRFGRQTVAAWTGIVRTVYPLPQVVVLWATPVPGAVGRKDETPVARLVGTT